MCTDFPLPRSCDTGAVMASSNPPAIDLSLAAFSDVAELVSGKRGRQRVPSEDDVEGGMWWAGQAQGLIDSVESCETVVRTIVADAENIVRDRLQRQLAPSGRELV